MTTTLTNQEPNIYNIGNFLSEIAQKYPDQVAIVEPRRQGASYDYTQLNFADFEADTTTIAAGLQNMGITPGMKIVLLVKPGVDFISLVIALLKAGVVMILIDPGIGKKHLLTCLQEANPDGFIAISRAHAIRKIFARRFPNARFHVTVGKRWFWGGPTLGQLRQTDKTSFHSIKTTRESPAAIIFTSGSTGPPKGVLYTQGNFGEQIRQIQSHYKIQPGGIDMAGFPLFALFNSVMGVTTIFPDMDFTKPAEVDPKRYHQIANEWKVTQAFGSPALWNRVGNYLSRNKQTIPTLKKVFSAGAPVPPHVLEKMKKAIDPQGECYTPYGATESLPVASISATEVLTETANLSALGKGTCVGKKFDDIRWKVIQISDDPIETISEVTEVPQGEIGELIVSGPVVTSQYLTRTEANAFHKVADGSTFWHRMGDVGYLDAKNRFWFCGRKGHRLETINGSLFTIPVESMFNQHKALYRSALVGVGKRGAQKPILFAEPWPDQSPKTPAQKEQLITELLQLAQENDLTKEVKTIYLIDALPVDIRHNSKIFREQLTVLATEKEGA